jgi:hypothetical protein
VAELVVTGDLEGEAIRRFLDLEPRVIALAGGSTPRPLYERLASLVADARASLDEAIAIPNILVVGQRATSENVTGLLRDHCCGVYFNQPLRPRQRLNDQPG